MIIIYAMNHRDALYYTQLLKMICTYLGKMDLQLQSVGAFADVIVRYLELHLPVQSVPITTKVVSSNPANGEVYSKQCYSDKVCQ
jgi:hypothetical protein